jgi:ankyrin repeat protein
MVSAGADPFIRDNESGQTAVSYIIATLPLDYLRALIEAGIGPNEDRGAGLVYSVRESAITHWQDEKVDYLLENGLELERRNLNGDTILLEAGYVVHDGGPFKKQIFLIERGADPTARNNVGQGICWGIENDPYPQQAGAPGYRTILARRLEDEFSIRCNASENFRPTWR